MIVPFEAGQARPVDARWRRAIAVACAVALVAAAAGAAAAWPPEPVELGEPSVLSQRGQRLLLAVPYGSAPGQRVSVNRFVVESVQVPPGYPAPDAAGFTLSKPPRRNLVMLRSREPVDAPTLTLTLRIADQPGAVRTWTLAVPPARFAPAAPLPATPRPDAAAQPRATDPPGGVLQPVPAGGDTLVRQPIDGAR